MRGQVIAVTLVLACGIATYVAMQSAFVSLSRAQVDYYSAFRLADVFAHAERAPESLVSSIAAIPGVDSVQTRIVMDVSLDIPGLDEPATGRLVSIPVRGNPILNDLDLREGRYVEPGRREEVVISEAFATANHLRAGDSISAVMNGTWERLRITGIALSPEYVYEVSPPDLFPDSRRFGVLWMSRDAIGPAFNMDGAFNDVSLSLARGADEQDVITRLDHLLDRYGSLGAYGRSDHISWRIVNDHIEQIRTSGVVLPSIFLAIVAFLLHTLMSRLVSTQRSQVAVLKAFGYRDDEVGWHYLKLALVAVSVGTVLGIGLGLWLGSETTDLFTRYFRFPSLRLQPDLRVILVAAGISGAAACLGALSAVWKVLSLAPAEAMHPEPPPRFQAGIIERLGLRAFLSPASRMIIRNLDRRRLRAFLSSLAIGFAVAILVVGSYEFDAINLLADIQFNKLQREDSSVIFREPRPDVVIHELQRLPGVMQVEGYRDTAVRIRFQNRSKRIMVSGLKYKSELRRPLGTDMLPVDLPPDGLLLNNQLAEILGVRLGDVVTVDLLEGERLSRQVIVASLADEPVGLGAYMEIGALHRLMKEGPLFSGAFLKVDPLYAPALYSSLKRTPEVSGVAVREATRASFWKNVGESLSSTTLIIVGFACVIAFGIVYNGTRIALSERGHELAALRVLGFTRAEIRGVLLGEQAILTLLAIPIGLGLGFTLSFLVSSSHSQDLLRLPFVVSARTCVFAGGGVLIAALFSGLVVARQLGRMDLTEALKSRE